MKLFLAIALCIQCRLVALPSGPECMLTRRCQPPACIGGTQLASADPANNKRTREHRTICLSLASFVRASLNLLCTACCRGNCAPDLCSKSHRGWVGERLSAKPICAGQISLWAVSRWVPETALEEQ